MSDIFKTIRADHDNHRALLNKISQTQGDIDQRRRLWNDFYYDVKSHAAAEEETFYSNLMADEDGQDDARHSVAEHQELDDIMEDLNDMDFSNPGWLNHFTTLKHDYEHHMEEEENEIFAKARNVLTEDEIAPLADHFQTRKRAELKLVDEKADASLED